MLRIPRAREINADEVGMQEWNAEEKLTRYWLVGVQCSGRLEAAVASKVKAISAV